MKKYGDMINGFGYAGDVKSVETGEDGINFALVQNGLSGSCAKVYLIPPVWEENRLPKIGDLILVGGLIRLVRNKNRDTVDDRYHDIAGKAIFCASSSPGHISEIQSWKATNPFAIVKSRKYGKVKLPLIPSVWFEERFPEKDDGVIVCAITSVNSEKVAGGGIFVRC